MAAVMTWMKCGCLVASAPDTEPVCIVHMCREQGTGPDLTGRTAKCTDCGRRLPSTEAATQAFFRYQPDRAEDSWYCGCRGWN